jgi:hypothetical protein
LNTDIENVYDQAMLITPAESEIFLDVDKAVSDSLLQADPQPALAFGRRLRREGQLKGLALAKLLAKLDQNWEMFKRTGIEEDVETIVEVEMGITPQTTRKYVRLWEDLFENADITESIKDRLYGKSIKSLLLLTAAARDGDDLDWEAVASATNGAEIRDIVRGVRGPATSSETSILLTMDRDGTIYARRGSDAERHMVGRLLIGEMNNQIIERAITRIIERAGVLWK